MYVHHMASHNHYNVWARCALLLLRSAGYLAIVMATTITSVSIQAVCLEVDMFTEMLELCMCCVGI